MAAGKFDRRVTLSRAGEEIGRDEFNSPIYSAPVEETVWASYMPVSDSEKIAAGEVMASLRARFRIRWSSATKDVSPVWTLTFEDHEFEILGAKEIGRREGIEITAVRRAE